MFSIMHELAHILTNSAQGSFLCLILTITIFSLLYIMASLTDTRLCLITVLFDVSLTISCVEGLYACWSFIFLPLKDIYSSSLCIFLIAWFIFLPWRFEFLTHVVMNPFVQCTPCKYFSHSVHSCCTRWIVSLAA